MTRAAQLELGAHVTTLRQHAQHLPPHGDMRRSITVADDVHSVLCSRQQDVDSIRSSQESTFALLVAPYQRDDDNFGFLAPVYAVSLHDLRKH